MRASLPWLVANATGRSHSGLIDVGSVIEIIHNFTLVHDDIMDDDDIRREEMQSISSMICRLRSMLEMQC